MAMPKCPKCDFLVFETVEFEPAGSRFKLISVQCARCGCVVGVLDYMNIGYEVGALAKKVLEIEQTVKDIDRRVRAMHPK